MKADLPIVNGRTRLYGTIGDPIDHVASPAFTTEAFRAAGIDALVVPIQAARPDFAVVMRGLNAIGNFDGLIVTLPHKVPAMAFVDHLFPTAQRVGAINAMRRNADGSWTGDMFDGKGLVRALREHDVDPAGAGVMLLGAGGTGSAIADAVAEAGAASIDIFDVDEARAHALAQNIGRYHATDVAVTRSPAAGRRIVINATPLGMAPGDPPPMQLVRGSTPPVVVDVAIAPGGTRFLREAKAAGCLTIEGQAMVRAQIREFLQFFADGRQET